MEQGHRWEVACLIASSSSVPTLDDETLGCGGTIVRHVERGDCVSLVVMADGVTSRGDGGIEERVDEARRAAKLLGIQSVAFFGHPDQTMTEGSLLEYAKQIENEVDLFAPTIIYTHWPHDLNLDHRVTSQAVMTACRPLPGSTVKRILYFEVPSSTEWTQGPAFTPNWYVDIDGCLPKKLLAFSEYSEGRDFPHPRSRKGIENLAYWRGAAVGVMAAEAFVLAREIQ